MPIFINISNINDLNNNLDENNKYLICYIFLLQFIYYIMYF